MQTPKHCFRQSNRLGIEKRARQWCDPGWTTSKSPAVCIFDQNMMRHLERSHNWWDNPNFTNLKMTTARNGGENEADTHSFDGACTASNVKQHQRGPDSKRNRINDQNRLKSGTPTTRHWLYQRMNQNGGRERQYGERQSHQDNPGKWTQDKNKGTSQWNYNISTESGFETVKTGKYILHCMINCTRSTYRERKKEEKWTMHRRHTQHLCEDSTSAPLHIQHQTLPKDNLITDTIKYKIYPYVIIYLLRCK